MTVSRFFTSTKHNYFQHDCITLRLRYIHNKFTIANIFATYLIAKTVHAKEIPFYGVTGYSSLIQLD